MLELRPACEHCNKPLPPDSLDARICSYECTSCVRGRHPGERVPELRWRVRVPADQAVEELEGRQLPRPGSREYEDQAQARRSTGARDVLGPDQEYSTREAIGIVSPRNESCQMVSEGSSQRPMDRASSEFVVLRQNAADLMLWVQHHRFSRQQTVDAFIQQCDAVDAAKHGV